MDIRETELGQAGWDAMVSRHGGPLQQSWRYGQASGRGVFRGEVLVDGQRAALVQMLQGPLGLAYIAGGPVWLEAGPRRFHPRKLPGRGPVLVTPMDGTRVTGFPVMTPATHARLDLSGSEDDLLAGLHQKWRNRLRKAQSAGMRVGQNRDLSLALALEGENRARKGYRGYPDAFVRVFCADPSDWAFFVARKKTKLVAAALFLRHGTGATYQIGWTNAEGRRLNAQNLVLWTAIRTFFDRGYSRLDLGQIDTERSPGLARFKFGTGAVARKLGSTRIALARGRGK